MALLPRSPVHRQSVLNRSMLKNSAGGRSAIVSPQPRQLHTPIIFGGSGASDGLYARLGSYQAIAPIMEQQALLVDYAGSAYGFCTLALGPLLPLVDRIVFLEVQGIGAGCNVDYISVMLSNAAGTEAVVLDLSAPFAITAADFFQIGESPHPTWTITAQVGTALGFGTGGSGEQTIVSSINEPYWVNANCGIS